MKKLSNTEAELKKSVAYKKERVFIFSEAKPWHLLYSVHRFVLLVLWINFSYSYIAKSTGEYVLHRVVARTPGNIYERDFCNNKSF